MKFLFIVHGNGNGHQTQALALKEELEKQGHSVIKCLLTTSGNTKAGNLLQNEFEDFSKITGFVLKYNKGELNIPKTVFNNTLKLPSIIWTLDRINNIVKFYNPDMVVSFYDPIYNISQKLYNIDIPYISIGHMYMFEDQNMGTPEYNSNLSILKIYNRITCLDADKVISLSYFPSSNNNLVTTGPILRNHILNIVNNDSDTNVAGYFHHIHDAKLIANAFLKYPQFNVNLFSNVKGTHRIGNTNIFPISGKKFIDCVKQSKIFLSSSGFESTSESLFLGKKILTFPIRNHIEQQLNAKCLSDKKLVYQLDPNYNIEDQLEEFLFDFTPNFDNLEKFKQFTLDAKNNVVQHLVS